MSARLSRPVSRERSSARFVGTLDTAGVSDPRARAPTLTRGRHPADLAFLVLAFVAFAVLLFLARDMTFHSDEWNVIAVPPGGTLEGWFAPYNEHWSTVLFLVYRAINELVGLRSYIPYLAAVLLVHVIAAAGLYRLLTLVSGRTIALAGAAILLFLGNAYNDLFWGWQVGFIGSTAAGIWALAALTEPPRRGNAVAAVLLLLVALATSGIGLPFLAAAVVYELLRPERRREAAWLLIPIGAYLAWYALFGRTAISVNNNPFTVEALTSAPGFVAVSIAHAVGATFGLDVWPGAIISGVGLLLIALAIVPAGRRPSVARRLDAPLERLRAGFPFVLANLAGVLVLYVLIALTRSNRGPEAPIEPRYVYPAGTFLLAAVGGAIGHVDVGLRRDWRRPAVFAGALVVLVALVGNLQALGVGRQVFLGYADQVRALTSLVDRYQHAPAVDPDRALWPMPKPAQLLDLLRHEGWPERSPPGDVTGIPSDAVDRALVQLVGPSFAIVPGPSAAPPSSLDPLDWQDYSGMTVTKDGGCLAIQTKPPLGLLILPVPDGSAVSLEGSPGASFAVALGRHADPQPPDSKDWAIPPSGSAVVLVPRLADGMRWKLEFALPANRSWRLCPVPHP